MDFATVHAVARGKALMTPDVADETAYYFNKEIPALALITKGVRLPAGKWIRVASAAVKPEQVEQMLGKVFPDLKGKVLTFATLTSESEVDAFERSVRSPP